VNAISFTVYGSPVAQPRTKARAITTKTGRTFAHVYEPGGKARQWKSDIKQEAVKHKPPTLFLGPVQLYLTFYLVRPQRLYGKKVSPYSLPNPSKPDVDNLFKAVADALTGIVWKDDSQVAFTAIKKLYHEIDKGPRVEIVISELTVTACGQ